MLDIIDDTDGMEDVLDSYAVNQRTDKEMKINIINIEKQIR